MLSDIGNRLYRTVNASRGALFQQAEIAELTFAAFKLLAEKIGASSKAQTVLTYPLGYRADRTTIPGQATYSKETLLQNCAFLANRHLAANGVVQLVTIMEALFGDVVREVVARFPQKLGSKRTIRMEEVFQATSLEEIHLRATDALLSDLSYKSPTDFAEAARSLLSINLLECPAFHKYAEAKTTRDILIHNRGVANDTYLRKAGAHARVKAGVLLPIDVQYFLESYEACLQVTEWMEQKLHDTWHSSEYEAQQLQQAQAPTQQAAVPEETDDLVVPPKG